MKQIHEVLRVGFEPGTPRLEKVIIQKEDELQKEEEKFQRSVSTQ